MRGGKTRVGMACSTGTLAGNGRSGQASQGLDLSTPSPNAFRPLTVRLDGAGEGGVCTLDIQVSARVAGRDLFAQMTLGGGPGPTMDVRLLPPTPPPKIEEVASP